MKTKAFRHGEMAFVKVSKLPKELKEDNTGIFSKGNTGNNHTFKGGKFYPKNEGQFIKGYFKAKDTKLYHAEHSPNGCEIPNGNYEVRKQSEFINGELRVIID